MIALTGTPGTGKTTVAAELNRLGYVTVSVDGLIEELGIRRSRRKEGEAIEVDTADLREKALKHWKGFEGGTVVVTGHLSHFAGATGSVVLRCHPQVLEKRLSRRGWDREKILENVRAEVMDVVLIEAVESTGWVQEIDNTHLEPSGTAAVVSGIIKGEKNNYPVKSRWAGELEKWF